MIRATHERTAMPRGRPRESWAVFVRVFVALLSGMAASMMAAPLFGQPVGGWTATPIGQANGFQIRMPLNRPVSRQSKLTLGVDTRWANNYGYRPIEVTIGSPKPTTADHLITVQLHSGWREVHVEQDFELPAGQTKATTTIALPQYHPTGQFLWWDVWVDGVKDKDLSASAADVVRSFGGMSGSPAGLSFLTVALPGVGGKSSRALVAPNTLDFEVLSLWVSEFPKRWIDYTCFDVVLLSWSELQLVSETNPEAFEAIQRWLHAGGQLWVGEVGDEFERLAELSKMFRLRESIASEVRDIRLAQLQGDSGDGSTDEAGSPCGFAAGFVKDRWSRSSTSRRAAAASCGTPRRSCAWRMILIL